MLQTIPLSTNVRALITSMVLSSIFVVLRTVFRWYKSGFAIEDYFCWFGLACFITMCSLYLTVLDPLYDAEAVAAGLIPPSFELLDEVRFFMRRLYAIQLLFWLTLWSVKFSLLWMFRGLVKGLPRYNRVWTGIVVFTAMALVGCEISQLLTCGGGLKAYFRPGDCSAPGDLRRQAASLYYSLSVDVLTDLLIMAIPIRLLYTLQIRLREKITAGVAFVFGFITIIIAIIRTVSLNNLSAGKDQPIPISWLILWGSIEGLTAIIVNCLPSFAVFLRSRIIATRPAKSPYQPSSFPPSTGRHPSIPLDTISSCGPVEGTDYALQKYRESAYPGKHKVGVYANSGTVKHDSWRDRQSSWRQGERENSSEESIIGMNVDHLDFTDGKEGVLVTQMVYVR